MRYAVLDLETTGLDLQEARVIEFGYAIYEAGTAAPLVMRSEFLRFDGELSEEIVKITGITPEMLKEFGREPAAAYEDFLDLVHKARVEVFVGHNALEFDKPILTSDMRRAHLQLPNLPWLDTKIDLPLDYKPKSTALVYMAADHGFLNPFAHRALFDTLTCGVLVSKYPMDKLLAIINSPVVEIRAVVSYDNRSKASKAGFRWDGDRKLWVKKLRSCKIPAEQAQADFPIVLL